MPPPSERLSPLHDIHVAAGAAFTDFAGWQMPVRYSSDLAEHAAVRSAAGLFDLSHMGEIWMLGPQAGEALDYALAGKLSAIEEGQAKYSLLLSPEGGILDDLVVYRTGPDRYLVVANASNREVVADELRARAAAFDCLVEDESDDIALIALQGPKAEEILRNVEGFDLPGLDDLKYYRAIPCTYLDQHGRGHNVLVARTGYTGEDGFEFYLAPDAAPELWQAIAETGAGSGLVPAGLAARDTLRLEAGMPLYGHELSTETFPVQAGLGRVVALKTKEGDFVGRAAVEAGPPGGARMLVGLKAANAKSFMLGQVRWLVQNDAGDLYAGIRVLPGLPAATAVRPTGLNVMGAKYVQAISLTAVPALNAQADERVSRTSMDDTWTGGVGAGCGTGSRGFRYEAMVG
ncbi:MAG: glycine cleavage system aminomethyltransferase GcvT, partial [Rhodoglobus sp.]